MFSIASSAVFPCALKPGRSSLSAIQPPSSSVKDILLMTDYSIGDRRSFLDNGRVVVL